MTYRPQSDNKKEKLLSLIMATLSVVLFALSGTGIKYRGLYQVTALVFAVISLQVYLKYVASDYVYHADEKSFKIYRILGKKSICVSSLDYEMSLTKVMDSKEYEKTKNQLPKCALAVNFAKNLNPKDYSVYLFEFNGKNTIMKFQPDEEFREYLSNKIQTAVNNRQKEEE